MAASGTNKSKRVKKGLPHMVSAVLLFSVSLQEQS
jgi:hypothetical protein